jgi:hypothetical protein
LAQHWADFSTVQQAFLRRVSNFILMPPSVRW